MGPLAEKSCPTTCCSLGCKWAKLLLVFAKLTKEEKSRFEAIASKGRRGRLARLIFKLLSLVQG